jgi:hypothetical protein
MHPAEVRRGDLIYTASGLFFAADGSEDGSIITAHSVVDGQPHSVNASDVTAIYRGYPTTAPNANGARFVVG